MNDNDPDFIANMNLYMILTALTYMAGHFSIHPSSNNLTLIGREEKLILIGYRTIRDQDPSISDLKFVLKIIPLKETDGIIIRTLMTNTASSPRLINLGSPPVPDIGIFNEAGDVIWNCQGRRQFLGTGEPVKLMGGASLSYDCLWNGTDNSGDFIFAGNYFVVGRYLSNPGILPLGIQSNALLFCLRSENTKNQPCNSDLPDILKIVPKSIPLS